MDTRDKKPQEQDGTILYDDIGFSYVTDTPDTAFKCRHWLEFYRLMERKRKHTIENIEMNIGCFYLLKATRSDRWYIREITQFTNPKALLNDISQGKIYLLYTEEVADIVRKGVESSGLSYAKFLERADASMNEQIIEGDLYYESGKVTNRSIHKDRINNIKKY